MLDVVVSFLLGAGTVLALQRLFGRRPAPAAPEAAPAEPEKPEEPPVPPVPQDAAPSELALAVDAFRAELDALPFDRSADGLPEGAAAEYERAEEAADRAGRVLRTGTDEDVRRALGEGRAALIRLDARLAGRPVPIDSLLPLLEAAGAATPEPYSGERFHYAGHEGEPRADFAIDWPEPGRPALVELVTEDVGLLKLAPVTRTDSRTRTEPAQVVWTRPYSGRTLLDPGPTHLKLTGTEPGAWSLRLLPIDAAEQLRSGLHGRCDTVLAHTSDEPLELVFQYAGGGHWDVGFLCACGADPIFPCPCDEADPEGSFDDRRVVGRGEARDGFVVPRRGLVTVKLEESAVWTIDTRPVTGGQALGQAAR